MSVRSIFKKTVVLLCVLTMASAFYAVCFATSYSNYRLSSSSGRAQGKEIEMNGSPGTKLRYVVTTSCSVSQAYGEVQCYRMNIIGYATELPVKQKVYVGKSEPWWDNTKTGKFSVDMTPYNNYIYDGSRATVTCNGTFENYS